MSYKNFNLKPIWGLLLNTKKLQKSDLQVLESLFMKMSTMLHKISNHYLESVHKRFNNMFKNKVEPFKMLEE